MSRSLPICFLLGVYSFKSYVQVFNLFWFDFCVQCKIVVEFHSIACGCPVHRLLKQALNTVYWWDYPFPTVYSWLPCCKLIKHMCMGLFLGSLFWGIYRYRYSYRYIFLATQHSLWDLSSLTRDQSHSLSSENEKS